MVILHLAGIDGRACCINARRIDAIVANRTGTEVYVGGKTVAYLVVESAATILEMIPNEDEEVAPRARRDDY